MHRLDYKQLEMLDTILIKVLEDVEEEFGPQTITSLYRKGRGIHSTIPLRAIDLRCYNEDMGNLISGWINNRWTYDAERPSYQVAIYHNSGQGWHLHLQTYARTRRA